MNWTWGFIVSIITLIVGYSIIGWDSKVEEIKRIAPTEIEKRGWRIITYDGYQWGSWSRHGGKVWYNVQDTLRPEIRYRINISMWKGELQYYYGEPEKLYQINIEDKN
jgi:hypothetical protein